MAANTKSANIGARLDRLPNSGWHIKMWPCWCAGRMRSEVLYRTSCSTSFTGWSRDLHFLQCGEQPIRQDSSSGRLSEDRSAIRSAVRRVSCCMRSSILSRWSAARSLRTYMYCTYSDWYRDSDLEPFWLYYLRDLRSMSREETAVHGPAGIPLSETGRIRSATASLS